MSEVSQRLLALGCCLWFDTSDFNLLQRPDCRRGYRLHRERSCYPHAALVDVRLIVECFLICVPRDSRINLLTRHAFLDLRIVRNGLQRDVRHCLVTKSAPDSLVWMCDVVVVEVGGHKALLG